MIDFINQFLTSKLNQKKLRVSMTDPFFIGTIAIFRGSINDV